MLFARRKEREKTQCSANSKRHDAGAGYLTIERDLSSFYEAGELNLVVGWEQWDDGNGIARTLDGHHCAVWHKSCRNSFNKTKLNRTLKTLEKPRPKQQQEDTCLSRGQKCPLCFFARNRLPRAI